MAKRRFRAPGGRIPIPFKRRNGGRYGATMPPFSLARPGTARFNWWFAQRKGRGAGVAVVQRRETITMSDGYLARVEIAYPGNVPTSAPMMIFMSGRGGDSLTNKARAAKAASLGVIGVSIAARGSGEAGVNINDPATFGSLRSGHRATVDLLEYPELIAAQIPELTGRVDLARIGYTGSSQGGRASWQARAWGGYIPQAGDEMVVQGWRSVGQAFLTPALVVPSNSPPQFTETMLPGHSTLGVGTRFRSNMIQSSYQAEPPEDSWSLTNSSLGPIMNPAILAAIQLFMSNDNASGFATIAMADANWQPEIDNYPGLAQASTVPTYANVSQLDAATEGNLHFDFYETLSQAGKDNFFFNITSGGHKSSEWPASNQAQENRLWAAMGHHLLNDDTGISVFSPGGTPASWAGIPRVRHDVLPASQVDYLSTSYLPVTFHVDTVENYAAAPVLRLFPEKSGTMGVEPPAVDGSVTIDRTWNDPTYDISDYIQETLDGDLHYSEIIVGEILADTPKQFSWVVPPGNAGAIVGEITLGNIYYQTSKSDVCIGAELWVNGVFVASGSHTRDGVAVGVDQGPHAIKLERVAFPLQAGDSITLRLVPFWAKERPYQNGHDGVFCEVPFFSNSQIGIGITQPLATALHLDIPFLALEVGDGGFLTIESVNIVDETGDPIATDTGDTLQAKR